MKAPRLTLPATRGGRLIPVGVERSFNQRLQVGLTLGIRSRNIIDQGVPSHPGTFPLLWWGWGRRSLRSALFRGVVSRFVVSRGECGEVALSGSTRRSKLRHRRRCGRMVFASLTLGLFIFWSRGGTRWSPEVACATRRTPRWVSAVPADAPKDTILTQRGFDMGGPVYLAWLGTMRLSSRDDVSPSMYSIPWCP